MTRRRWEDDLAEALRGAPVDRRTFLLRAMALGVSAAHVPALLRLAEREASAAPATPRRGGTLRYGMNTPVVSFDPHRFTGAAADALNGMTYSRLVQLTPDWNGVEADLATRWDVSPDLKAYTFQLRPNAKFHDGSPVTAEDVVFSFQRILDAATGAYLRPIIADVIGEVTAPAPTTVRFVLRRPFAAFLPALALPTAAILSKKWTTGGGDLNRTQMGTGPMKVVSIEPNVRITLTRHDQYFEPGVPYLDGMQLLSLPDDTTRSTSLRNGSVDFIDFVPYRDVASIRGDANLRLHSDSVSSGLWAFPNFRRPPMDNASLRQAINFAINREAVLRAAFFGNGALMDNVFMPKTSWAFSNDLPRYPYNPARARELIQRSGVPSPIRVEILTASNVLFWRSGAQVLQANLVDVGLDAQLVATEFAETVRRFNAQDYQITIWGGGPLYADPDFLYAYFHSRGTVGRNTGYVNRKLEGLLEEARTTITQRRRRALYLQVYQILMDEAPWFPMTYREQAEASSASVQGYQRVMGSNWNGIRIAKSWLSR